MHMDASFGCRLHFIILGTRHLRYLVERFLDFYRRHRPHQGLDYELTPRPPL
jgi:hypothetical protein